MGLRYNLERSFDTAALHAGADGNQAAQSAFETLQARYAVLAGVHKTTDAALGQPQVALVTNRVEALVLAICTAAAAAGEWREQTAHAALTRDAHVLLDAEMNEDLAAELEARLDKFAADGVVQLTYERIEVSNFPEYSRSCSCGAQVIIWLVQTLSDNGKSASDLARMGRAAKEQGATLIVDQTNAGSYLCRPVAKGAHLVVESFALVDHSETCEQSVAELATELTCVAVGSKQLATALKVCCTAQAPIQPSVVQAKQLLDILETSSLVSEAQNDNALALARYLEAHPQIAWVRYAGIKDDPMHAPARASLSHGMGRHIVFALIGSGIQSGSDAPAPQNMSAPDQPSTSGSPDALAFIHTRFANELSLISQANSVLAARASRATSITLTTHGEISLFVGLENLSDLIDDLEQAFISCASRV